MQLKMKFGDALKRAALISYLSYQLEETPATGQSIGSMTLLLTLLYTTRNTLAQKVDIDRSMALASNVDRH